MLTAAAASISFRCSLARFPPSDSRREAVTVVSRSSTSRTGTWTAGANRTARSRLGCCWTFAATQAPRKPDQDLDRLIFSHHRRQLGDFISASRNRRQRVRQQTLRVTRRNANPRVSPVERQPYALPHLP